MEFDRARLAVAVVARCRAERVEPPASRQIERLVASAVRSFEKGFCVRTAAALSPQSIARLEALVAEPGDDPETAGGGRSFFDELKQDPGAPGLESLLAEISKLQRVRAVGLPPDLFEGISEKLVALWRVRAAKQYPSALRASAAPVRLTLLAALCRARSVEITGALVDLFTELVLRINTRAEKKVEGEFVKEAHRVRSKETILFRVAEAALSEPNGTVRRVIFPVAGESTLRALAAEAAANEARYRARVRTVLRSSYSNHWRRMLHPLLSALELSVQQHRAPAGDGRGGSAQALSGQAGAR